MGHLEQIAHNRWERASERVHLDAHSGEIKIWSGEVRFVQDGDGAAKNVFGDNLLLIR